MSSRIAVLDDWNHQAESLADWRSLRETGAVTFFSEPLGSLDKMASTLAGFDVIVAMRERTVFSAAVLDRLPALRLLCYTGARNASVDVPACTAHGVMVCNTSASRPTAATAELALGLMLAVARNIALSDAEIRAGRFQDNVGLGIEMKGSVLGLLGLGKLGSAMAHYGQALGMQTIAWSQNLTDERAREAGVARVEKDELFARSDVLSIHLVLSGRTRDLVGAAELAKMKPGAILVNTSRGPIVDTAALLEALESHRIWAGLDVYDQEPLPPDHPLRRSTHTVLTPHLGYVTRDTMTEFYRDSVENIRAWLAGKPIRVVNPEVAVKSTVA